MKEELNRFVRIAESLLNDEESNPVVKPRPFTAMRNSLDLELRDEAMDEAAFETALRELVLNTPRTQTRSFFNQLFGGRRPRAYLGELLAVMLNNSMYTYKVGGPMIAVEKIILRGIARQVGFKKDTEGTIAPGGSMTNYMAMLMARDKYDSSARYDGISKKLVAYTSEESHYSVAKNAAFCGLGRNNVFSIDSDDRGRIDVKALEKRIQADLSEGKKPFLINATSGTTVLGAYDDLNALADLRDKYDLWLHSDAAYGGSVIFTDKYRHLVSGAERCDSFSINAHKMLGTPITCSIIITPHKKCLYDSFSNEASYLYQGDVDEINPGKISLQCGRRNDALKFWCLWKSLGTKGLGQMVEKEFALAEYARKYVDQHPDYTLYSFPESVNICFNYKNIPAEKICQKLYDEGQIMVGYGKFKSNTFVRLVSVNSNNEEQDFLNFFRKLESLADSM